MRKIVLFLVLSAVLSSYVFCGQYSSAFRNDSLDFGKINTGEQKSIDVYLINNFGGNITIDSLILNSVPAAFGISCEKQVVAANDSIKLTVSFQPMQNVNYHTVVFIVIQNQTTVERFSIPLVLTGRAAFPDSRYAFSENQWGEDLKTSLNKFVSSNVTSDYKTARTAMFGTIDNVNGEVECIYTGRKLACTGIPDVNTTHFNNEHTWPQAYGAQDPPENSDIFHMRPTYEPANSARANYPYGYVVTVGKYDENGSRLGKDQYDNTVFEVRPEKRGDIARGIFYFALRYGNKTNSNNQPFLDTLQYGILKEWNANDMPDESEKARNNAIENFQKNRNPFIDYPQFIDRLSLINKFSIPALKYTCDTNVIFNLQNVNTSKSVPVYIYSNKDLNITSVSFEPSDGFSCANSMPAKVSAYDVNYLYITAKSASANYIAKMTITFDDNSQKIFTLKALNETSVHNDSHVTETVKIDIVPNPIENTSMLTVQNVSNSSIIVKIYGLDGRYIKTLTSGNEYSNIFEYNLSKKDLSAFGSVFFVQVETNGKTFSKQIQLSK